ncbi:hypothetical protein [Halomonas mongoliensis]|uniref:hypothetical protein n=1 Tax=Halomonas mongoliensis TaxID=321265 RepID=UPI00403AE588
MIRLTLIAILLVLSPLAKAGLIFDESEKVVEIFQGQDFDANLAKAEEGDVRAQYLVGPMRQRSCHPNGLRGDQRALPRRT